MACHIAYGSHNKDLYGNGEDGNTMVITQAIIQCSGTLQYCYGVGVDFYSDTVVGTVNQKVSFDNR